MLAGRAAVSRCARRGPQRRRPAGHRAHCRPAAFLPRREAPRGHAQAYPLAADGQSVPCEAGKPIGDRTWPIPATDDAIRTFVVFSDRKLKADTVVLQIGERLAEGPNATVTSMDLRAPGRVALETLEIKPAEVRLAK